MLISSCSRRLLMVIVQDPTQPLTTLHGLRASRFRGPTEQQDVGLPLMIPIAMVMLIICAEGPPQGALTKENDLRQTLLLDRSHPALSVGVQVRASCRQGKRLDRHGACRKLNPAILVMQSAQGWATKNVPGAIDGARDRRIFLQG